MRRARSSACRQCQRGAVYLFLIFAIALSGVLLAGFGQLWSTASRRDKEVQLLHVGDAYSRAIASYYDATPGEAKQYPLQLEDLLLDKRFPDVRRHLRQLYPDPMSGKTEWMVIREQGRIVGVQSTDTRKPLKQGGFGSADAGFDNAVSYSEWRFVGRGGASLPSQAQAQVPALMPAEK